MTVFANNINKNMNQQITDDVTWHPDVQFYSVHDAKSGELVGHFFLDLYPRDGKFGHQCVLPIRPACVKDIINLKTK